MATEIDEPAVSLQLAPGEHLSALDESEVTTVGNQEAYGNFLSQVSIAIQEGDIVMAIDKLEKTITRAVGCAIRGEVDGKGQDRDWVTDCAQQAQIYPALVAALEALYHKTKGY
jgi:hypothetical protein